MDVAASALSDPAFASRYELGPRLGEGGMGAVHRGVQRALGRAVAIKFLGATFLADPEYRERFVREARLAAGLIHSNVVAVFDFGVAGEIPFLVTELVEGETLAAALERQPLQPSARVFHFTRSILDGLEAIHRLAIVHRDLKPANVLIGLDEPPPVKIADFGIAKQTVGGGGALTAVGVMMGSPAYLAPEQVTGDPVSPSTDLYSLSIVLFRMVLGRHPFTARSAPEMLAMQRQVTPEVPTDLVPGLRKLLVRGLAKVPDQRPTNTQEYRALLGEAEREVIASGGWTRTDLGITLSNQPPAPAPAQVPAPGLAPVPVQAHSAPARPKPGRDPIATGHTIPLPPPPPPSAGGSRRIALVLVPVLVLWSLLLLKGSAPVEDATASATPASPPTGAASTSSTPPTAPSTASAAAPVRPSPTAPPEIPAADALKAAQGAEQMAASGRPSEAATQLFAMLARRPSLTRLTPEAVARDAVASAVDRSLFTIVESTLAALPRNAPEPAADPAVAHRVEPFFAALASRIARREHEEARDLIAQFLRPAPGAPSSDGARLHRGNALYLLQQLLSLRIARTPEEMIIALRGIELSSGAQPGPPGATWSEAVLAQALEGGALPGGRRVQRLPSAGWPHLEGAVEEVLRALRSTWIDPVKPRIGPSEMRRLLLVSELVLATHDPTWRATGNVTTSVTPALLVSRLPIPLQAQISARLAADLKILHLDRVGLATPLPRPTLLKLARALDLRRPLTSAVARDAGE